MDSKDYGTVRDLAVSLSAFLAQSARHQEEIDDLRKTVTERGLALQMITEGYKDPREVADAGLFDTAKLKTLYQKHLGN